MKPATLKQKIVLACVPRAATLILGGLTASWRIGEAGAVSASPASRPSEPKIYAVWHEVALAAGHYRGLRLHALASQSFDGELISRALVQLGWAPPARGSSTRGGSGGTLELQGFLRQGESVLLTVDGPSGFCLQAGLAAEELGPHDGAGPLRPGPVLVRRGAALHQGRRRCSRVGAPSAWTGSRQPRSGQGPRPKLLTLQRNP